MSLEEFRSQPGPDYQRVGTMPVEQLEKLLKQGGRIQFTPPSDTPPKVVEVGGAIFDLNDVVAIEDSQSVTWVYLRGAPRVLILEMRYEAFKKAIGANPVQLEIPDEEG